MTLAAITKQTAISNYYKLNSRYGKQYLVMTIAAKLKRIYKFECKELDITLKDIWAAVKEWFNSLSTEPVKKSTAIQPDLRNEYKNKPVNYNYGD